MHLNLDNAVSAARFTPAALYVKAEPSLAVPLCLGVRSGGCLLYTSIEGLSPAISIDQKSTNRNPRSTVGTVTEIYDYMRLLYARIGIPHCPKCGKEIHKQTIDQMVDQIMSMPERTKIQLLAPVVRGRKGEHVKVLDQARKSGYVRVRIDGSLYELSEEIRLEKNIKHNIEIVVDRLIVKEGIEKRLTDSIETVMALSGGLMMVDVSGGEPVNFSQSFSCPDCAVSIDLDKNRCRVVGRIAVMVALLGYFDR